MVAAIPSGFHVDGYAGDKLWLWITWCFLFNELNDFVQNESVEPAWPIHEGNLLCRTKPMDFEDDLIDTHIRRHTQSFRTRRGGQPENCMNTLRAILLDMLATSDA